MSAIQQELVSMQTATAVNKAKELQANGASQELDGDAFLMLMLEQLKNQDPLNPMDNSEMLAQQAQFTQIQELQKMNETITQSNMIQQANSLVGKTVHVVDPNNSSRLITGVVSSANFTSDSATVTVNGVEYPLGLVAVITDGAAPSDTETIQNLKLSELNNTSGITSGYITLTTEDNSYQKTHKYIQISNSMTVEDFQKELKNAGIESSITNGILTIEKGSHKTVGITQGKINDSTKAASNIVEKMQMFQNESGNLETTVLNFNRS